MKWKNPLIISSVVVICLIIGLFIGYRALTKKDTVAVVNGERITKDQLYSEMVKTNGREILDGMISKRLIELEIKKQNVAVSEEEIQTELQKYYENYGGQDAFTEAVQASGYTLNDVRQDIINNLGVRKILEPQITITEEEMKSYFEENKSLFALDNQEASFENSQEEIRNTLIQSKLEEAYTNWIQTLYEQYSVINYLG